MVLDLFLNVVEQHVEALIAKVNCSLPTGQLTVKPCLILISKRLDCSKSKISRPPFPLLFIIEYEWGHTFACRSRQQWTLWHTSPLLCCTMCMCKLTLYFKMFSTAKYLQSYSYSPFLVIQLSRPFHVITKEGGHKTPIDWNRWLSLTNLIWTGVTNTTVYNS